MQHVFEVSTGFGLHGLAAIIDRFDVGRVEDRVLLVMNTVPAAEAVPPLHESQGFAPLLARFGRIVDLNTLIAPEHPHGWSPEPGTHHARLATAQLLDACGIDTDAPHTLWVESIQSAASYSLTRLFERADVNVYADGLMTYGPTRIDVSPLVGDRIRGVYHLDLVPGHAPAVLREYAPEYHAVPVEAFLSVLRGAQPEVREHGIDGPVTLVVGQYLADLGLLTPEQDAALLDRMIAVAIASEPEATVLVRAHPRAVALGQGRVLERYRARGYDVRPAPTGGLVETLFTDLEVRAVVSCFSTALFTARSLGIRTIAVGARELLRTLRPYQNSNRMAIVLADLLSERAPLEDGPVEPAEADQDLVALVLALTALSMQPGVLESWLGRYDEQLLALSPGQRDVVRRYVSAVRLRRIVPDLRIRSARPPVSRLRSAARRVPALRSGWRAARRARTAWRIAVR